VKATGQLDAGWNPNAGGTVEVIRVTNGTVYVGGSFTTIGGQTRNRIAKLDTVSGAVDATFNPNVNGEVYEIAPVNSSLYVGGRFTTIDGQTRNRMAKLNAVSGSVDATFNPNASGAGIPDVIEITYVNGSLYVGGEFNTIGGLARNQIAKLDTTSGSANATFNPGANDKPFDIEYINGSLYVGGFFTTIGGQPRNYITKLDTTGGSVDATFNPNASTVVYDIAYDANGSLYVGGNFTTIGGQARSRIAKLDTTSGTAMNDFSINLGSLVSGFSGDGIQFDNGVVYIPGYFTSPTSRFFVTGGTSLTTIPTVGEWAMIVLTLSLFCVAVMYVRKPVFALNGTGQGGHGQPQQSPVQASSAQNFKQNMMLSKDDFAFRAKWFFPLSFVVTTAVWSACVYFHETAVRDMIGTTCTGIVGGYLLQLLALWVIEEKK
jgi:hypothetical protein